MHIILSSMAKPVKLLGYLVLITLPLCSFAQFTPGKGEDSIEVTPNIAPHRSILKLALLSPLEQMNSIRLSGEFTLNDHLSLEPEIGYIYSNSDDNQRINGKMINLEGRLGLRYYFPEKIITGLYTSLLITYAVDNYRTGIVRNNNPAYPDSGYYDFSNPARFQENDFGAFWIVGLQPVISKHFNFDISGGLGCLAKQVITEYDPYLPPGTKLPESSMVYKLEGVISLKVGYIFY